MAAKDLQGIVLYDKPAGMTSHDVVSYFRRKFEIKKVGHAGTLDPFATGLLIVLIGRATRTQRFFMGLDKSYDVTAQFGATSDTGDRTGSITQTGVVPEFPLDLPTGKLKQRPPAYSAVKIDGERAYKKARRGEEVVTKERTVTVSKFEQLWQRDDRAEFRVDCSSGTYIRSLVMALGDAYCEELRRTSIGNFKVADANENKILGINSALEFMPEKELDAEAAEKIKHGIPVAGTVSGSVRLVHRGRLLAIAESKDDRLKVAVGLASENS